jgi:hypothetical protein
VPDHAVFVVQIVLTGCFDELRHAGAVRRRVDVRSWGVAFSVEMRGEELARTDADGGLC